MRLNFTNCFTILSNSIVITKLSKQKVKVKKIVQTRHNKMEEILD